MRQPLLAPLAVLGADQLRHLRLHQLLHDPAQTLAQEVDALVFKQEADDLLSRHPLRLGHRGAPFVDPLAGTDESERRGGRTNYPAPSDALLHHATGRDRVLPAGSSVTRVKRQQIFRALVVALRIRDRLPNLLDKLRVDLLQRPAAFVSREP